MPVRSLALMETIQELLIGPLPKLVSFQLWSHLAGMGSKLRRIQPGTQTHAVVATYFKRWSHVSVHGNCWQGWYEHRSKSCSDNLQDHQSFIISAGRGIKGCLMQTQSICTYQILHKQILFEFHYRWKLWLHFQPEFMMITTPLTVD